MIVFNNKSADELGLLVVPFTLTTTAQREYDYVHIPGREEPILAKNNSHRNVKIKVECDLLDPSRIDEVHEWLTGTGVLVDSRYPDKYRTAEVLDPIEETAINEEFINLVIPFTCSAFRYALEPSVVTIGTDYTAVENSGTIYSEPKIEISLKKNESPILKGDVNFDGRVTASDAALVLAEVSRVAAGGEPTFTDEQNAAADINGDGIVTASDAALILDIATKGAVENPNTPSYNLALDVNGEELIVGVPNAVVTNGFTITIDSALKLIYYTNQYGEKINILQYSYGDLPLLHTGTNYVKYSGEADSVKVIVNERWR